MFLCCIVNLRKVDELITMAEPNLQTLSSLPAFLFARQAVYRCAASQEREHSSAAIKIWLVIFFPRNSLSKALPLRLALIAVNPAASLCVS